MMMRGMLWVIVTGCVIVLTACTRGSAVPTELTPSAWATSSSAALPSHARLTPNPATPPADIVLTALQAQQIATVNGFFEAYNAGHRDEALAFFDADAVFSDCDYREQRQIGTANQITVADWLTQRIADHDQFVIERIVITPQSSTALGVVYARRTNDTLRSLGQPDGIEPQLATKIILTADGRRIGVFSHGCG